MIEHASVEKARSRLRRSRGTVLVLVAILLVVLLGICALAIDLGVAFVASTELQNTADAAALAGACAYREGFDEEAARQAAIDVASRNLVLNDAQIITPDDVTIGSWNSAAGCVVPWNDAFSEFAVQVTTRRTRDSANGPVPTFFANIWGKKSIDVARSAVAGIPVEREPRRPVQMVIVQDASGSFREEWREAIDADRALVELVNGVAVEGDLSGFVAFSEGPNNGLKSTTYPGNNRLLGEPRKVNPYGQTDEANGQVTPLQLVPAELDHENQTALPAGIDRIYQLFANDHPGGYTDPSGALNWAVDWFDAHPGSDAERVIVFVSDGMPYPRDRRAPTIAAVRRAGLAGIRLHSVTLTNESSGSYGTEGSDFEFNKALVEQYNLDPDGNSLGGCAFQTSDPSKLRDLLIGIGKLEIGRPRLFK